MTILARAIAAVAVVALSACSTMRGRADAELRAQLDRFIHAVNVADTESFVACFAADATAFFPSNASAVRRTGVAEIRNAVAPVFAQGPRTPAAQLGDLVVTQLDDFAVASFDAGSGAMHARRTLVLRRIGGQWRIVHLHASNVSEP